MLFALVTLYWVAGAVLGWEMGADALGKSRHGFLLTGERWSTVAAGQLERSWRF